MEKNIGKRQIIDGITKKLNGQLWNGVDKSLYDDNGILLKSYGHDVNTRSAKEAKLLLLKHFTETSSQPYIIIFEDDIILHKNFYEYFPEVIKFADTHPFKLLYLGVNRPQPKLESNNLIISQLFDDRRKRGSRHSGAYGVIINKSVFPTIFSVSNDPMHFMKPFDVYSLGHIQSSYPKECFVCNPYLVVPEITVSDIRTPKEQSSVWSAFDIDMNDYCNPTTFPVYILVDDNEKKLKQFVVLLAMFIPYIQPIFICREECNVVHKIYGKTYQTIEVSNFSEEIIGKNIASEKYALTNIYVNWTKNISNIFDETRNIKYEIKNCPRCKRCEKQKPEILNGLKIINHKNDDFIQIENENLFYVYNCLDGEDGKMHKICS